MRAPERDVRSTTTAAELRCVTVEYQTVSGRAAALQEVDAIFERSRLTVVAGPSGSGKSSLLRVLAGLQLPTAGTVLVDGTDIGRLRAGARRRLRRQALGIVLQSPADNLVEYLRAVEQVELAARLRGADRDQATQLLAVLGVADRASCFPSELSGGEQQRVALAAAAIGDPRVLLADEPTGQLDDASAGHLIDAIRALVDRGSTVVAASHDASVIAAADRIITLVDGRVVDA